MINKFDFFISYRRENSRRDAELLYDKLKSKGYKVFLDKNELPFGEKFPDEIKKALKISIR